jgi:hypothetical protein
VINIYVIKHKGAPIYVGQTSYDVTKRWTDHKSKSKDLTCTFKLYNKMRKYPIEEFSIELIESTTDWAREEHCIGVLNTRDNGCNHALGGKVNRGMVKTERQRQLISERSKTSLLVTKYNGSDEQKTMLREKMKGRDITWGQSITDAKSDGPYLISVNGAQYQTMSINKFAKEHGLNTASLRLSLWENKQVKSKGRIVSVSKVGG